MSTTDSGRDVPKKRPLGHFWPEWPTVALSAGLATVAAFAEAVGLILVVAAAAGLSEGDGGLTQQELGPVSIEFSVVQAAVLAAALIVISAVGRIAANYVAIRKMAELTHRWRGELVAGFLGSTYEFESSRRRGEVLETAGQQSNMGARVLEILVNALNSVISMVILIGAAFAVEPLVASVLLVGGAVLLMALRPLTLGARRLSTRIAEVDIRFGNELDEMVRVARDIKVFGAADEFAHVAGDYAEESATMLRRVLVSNRSVPILFQTFGLLLLLLALAVVAAVGGATLAAIGGAAVLLLRGIRYGQSLSRFQQTLARSIPYVERVFKQLADYERNAESFGNLDIDRVEAIELDGVSYEYAEDGPPAVGDVRLTIKERGISGLVGPSGSGKSTIAQLLLRLRSPSKGLVLVNGIDANEFDPESWRRTVSFVPQETELIHGTVADNVAFFRDWVTSDQIEAAIEAVGLSDHVRSLPEGLDTQVGPTVREFSGGQRQRIGIARALAGNPSLFVLDEPTSALDSESEQWIMRTLSHLRESRIVIIITHRPSTQEHCDVLVRLDRGQVVSTERVGRSGPDKN